MGDNAKARGQNFSTAELKQLCCSWMHISQDPIVGGGQRNITFGDQVGRHYNDNRPKGTQERGTRSLESKWGEVKHDVAKFAGSYSTVVDAHHSGTNKDDTISKAKELYQTKHPKGKEFQFVDQWNLLKDCPRFALAMDDINSKVAKGKGKGKSKFAVEQENVNPQVPGDQTSPIDLDPVQSWSTTEILDKGSVHGGEKRPMGNKTAKKLKHDDCSQRISAYAQRDMMHINTQRLKLLEEQNRQNLFSLKAADVDEECREYFQICRARELKAFKRKIEMEEDEKQRLLRRPAARTPLPLHRSSVQVPSPEGNPSPVSPPIHSSDRAQTIPEPSTRPEPVVVECSWADQMADLDKLIA